MPAPKIVVVGSSNIDLVMNLPALPSEGQTVGGGTFAQVFGGKGANQAVAAARAGGDVTFISALGDDEYAKGMTRAFAADAINTNHLTTIPSTPTGTAVILTDAQGRNCIAIAAGANGELTPSHVEQAANAITESDALVLQLEVPPDTVRAALRTASDAGVRTILNYAPSAGLPVELSELVSVLIVNEHEAAELLDRAPVTSAAEAEDACRALVDRGVGSVVITLGAAGAVALADGHTHRVAGRAVKAVDTTAAGDTFVGAFTVALCEGSTWDEALAFANAAASLSVQTHGAQPSVPSRSAIEAALNDRT